MSKKRYPYWQIIIGLIVLTTACALCSVAGAGIYYWLYGREGEEQAEVTVPPEITVEPSATFEKPEDPVPPPATPTAAPTTGPVTTLEEVKLATIQIVQEGSFVDIEDIGAGQRQGVGSGSGFIIDPSGIAVTNNHVVAGEGRIKVHIDGEEEWKRATVLGVSECSDLAVIDIEGDGYPYMTWYEGDIKPPLKVFTAGFPLGDPEFTMTSGIVSKAQADGDSAWASVDHVIEHDATINPGNSGGPLVSEEGQVVAVNYASNSKANQYFAIPRDEALKVISQLRQGHNVDALGLNGQAFKGKRSDDSTVSGIFISSVKSGSLADQAGLQGGDIILKMEGLTMASDGSMASYCDILRGRSSEEATLSLEIVRTQTDPISYWTGQVNGRELELASKNLASATATGIVVTDKVKLRKGPGTNYESVGNLMAGDEVRILRRSPSANWVVVETVDKQKGGWVASEFIKVLDEADLNNLPIDDSLSESSPGAGQSTGCGGLGSFSLWGQSQSCSLAAGQDKWYYFDSGQDKEAMVIAFMRNAEQVDLFVYNGNDLPVWRPDPIPNNMGAGTEEGNRDNDPNTREFVWQGPISTNTRYYVRFVNRGNKSLQFCFVSRPDGVCKP
ncbi:MAG: SH3 domain-containing protein [Anaerolineales bacterium]|nr:SH3 domain-containing protein [Anaerolineales bacterium]